MGNTIMQILLTLSFANELMIVNAETIDNCIKIIMSLGQSSLIAKSDLKNAYFSLRVRTVDSHFLGFTWLKKFYFGKSLPMGSGIS